MVSKIIRLILHHVGECDICKKKDDTKNYDSVGFNFCTMGWTYCPECLESGDVKNVVLDYLNTEKIIPIHWLVCHKKFVDNDEFSTLKFYRKTINRVQLSDSLVNCGRSPIVLTNNELFLLIPFSDGGNSFKRKVSLANLFAYNNVLYDELIACKNLFYNDSVIICYDELSNDIKKIVEESRYSSHNNSIFEF